jgi:hypothetical protein
VVVWWLLGLCLVVVWWLDGGCLVVVWWLFGGCLVAEAQSLREREHALFWVSCEAVVSQL